MKWIKRLFVGLAVLVLVVLVVAYVLPRVVAVRRSVVIAAEPAKVFLEVNSLRRFSEWSP